VAVENDRQTGDAVPGAGEAQGPAAVVITGEDWLDAICPFLRARDGSWRSASPAREHRCWASEPPSELAVLTQQRLCLVRAHDGCERFLHARELRSTGLTRDRQAAAAALVPSRARAAGRSRRDDGWRDGVRSGVARVVARPRRAGLAAVVLAGGVVLSVLVSEGGRPPAPAVSPGPSVVVDAPPSFEPEVTLGPDGLRRYRVRAGDTLRTIAERFGISVRELRSANVLGDPPRLQPGDVILVPPPG